MEMDRLNIQLKVSLEELEQFFIYIEVYGFDKLKKKNKWFEISLSLCKIFNFWNELNWIGWLFLLL